MIVTEMPPAELPMSGDTEVTVGGDTGRVVVVDVVVVVVVGRVGSGAMTTFGSPRLMRTNSSTVMTGAHSPPLQTMA